MSDLKIGLKIQPSIYVTVKGLNIVTPMDISLITEVVTINESETIITYNGYVFVVGETKEDIEKAMRDAYGYKDKCISYINSLLDDGQSDKTEIC